MGRHRNWSKSIFQTCVIRCLFIFMDSPLQGKTTLLTLDFQHQVSKALPQPIHWILLFFCKGFLRLCKKKPFYSSYVTRLKTYTSKERGVCAKTPNFQTAHQQLQFFLISVSKLFRKYHKITHGRKEILALKRLKKSS